MMVASQAWAQPTAILLDILYVETHLNMKQVTLTAKASRLIPRCVPLKPNEQGDIVPSCPEAEVVINSYGLSIACFLDTQEISVTIGPMRPSDVKWTMNALLPPKPMLFTTAAMPFPYRELRIEESTYDGSYWLTFGQFDQGLLEAIAKADTTPKATLTIGTFNFDLRAVHAPPEVFTVFAKRCMPAN